jgi:hypothetical protein
MNDLRTLFLNESHNLPFFLALNPDEDPSRRVLCPRLENLILYIEELELLCIGEFVSMAKARALNGAKLLSVTVVGENGLVLDEVFQLREHVGNVKCVSVGHLLRWDTIPAELID